MTDAELIGMGVLVCALVLWPVFILWVHERDHH
jgi:hypothetical protein